VQAFSERPPYLGFGCVELGSPGPAFAGRATAWAGRAQARLRADLLTQRTRSPDAGRGADAGREAEGVLMPPEEVRNY
jgi:hypothetical protein